MLGIAPDLETKFFVTEPDYLITFERLIAFIRVKTRMQFTDKMKQKL
jgi:hypothetical protein